MEMNQNPMNAPMGAPSVPPQSPLKKKESGIGQAVAIVIIVALALGGLYYLSMNISTNVESLPTVLDLQNSDDPEVQALMTQGSSDELSAIDADLSATNLGAVDAAVMNLDADLQSQ